MSGLPIQSTAPHDHTGRSLPCTQHELRIKLENDACRPPLYSQNKRTKLAPNLNPFSRRVSRTHMVTNFIRKDYHPESLRMKFVRFGIHQVCPGVVNSLGTPRRDWAFPVLRCQRGKTTYKPGEPAGKTGDPVRSEGPDQHFDAISIWRLYLRGVEPGISRWLVGITTATPWMLSSSLIKFGLTG